MKKIGHYIFNEKIGEGEFGIVYKATHDETNLVYAVKTMSKERINSKPKLRKLFDTEMFVMSKINHPNILHLHEYLETSNNYYLILEYCRDGDLDHHVTKNKYLGEVESIYFLKQIMNGFKELHKHKIMHRDFKLENIFLDEDRIIIGDFGFAKSGSKMATTILGSPIIMAPELLNAKGIIFYNNKSDLWSIGICFYQMIFGDVPWEDLASIEELKQKVKTNSGNKLFIPKVPTITDECKDLLQRLLDPNPKTRIEWYDLFNHTIFSTKYKSCKEKRNAFKQSVMFRSNEYNVEKMFKFNKKDDNKKIIELVEPLEIKIEPSLIPKETQEVKLEAEHNLMIMKGRQRYVHEKKIVVFMMQTCRKLRNLAKQKDVFGGTINSMMFAGLLLMKKGILSNEKALKSIKNKTNSYNIDQFEIFSASPNGKTILEELIKDTDFYLKLYSHWEKKMKTEIGLDNVRCREVYEVCTDPKYTLEDISLELKKESKTMILYEHSNPPLNPKLREGLQESVANLFVSANSETELEFNKDGVIFDWRFFEKHFTENRRSLLLRGLKEGEKK